MIIASTFLVAVVVVLFASLAGSVNVDVDYEVHNIPHSTWSYKDGAFSSAAFLRFTGYPEKTVPNWCQTSKHPKCLIVSSDPPLPAGMCFSKDSGLLTKSGEIPLGLPNRMSFHLVVNCLFVQANISSSLSLWVVNESIIDDGSDDRRIRDQFANPISILSQPYLWMALAFMVTLLWIMFSIVRDCSASSVLSESRSSSPLSSPCRSTSTSGVSSPFAADESIDSPSNPDTEALLGNQVNSP